MSDLAKDLQAAIDRVRELEAQLQANRAEGHELVRQYGPALAILRTLRDEALREAA